MSTLYITDLDSTLLDGHSRVSPRSAQLLNEAISKGANVSVATARTPATLADLLKDVDFRLPLVNMTGSSLWDIRTRKYSDVKHFDPAVLQQMLEIYRCHDLPTFIYTLRDDMIHIYHLGKMTERERLFMQDRLDSPFKRFHVDENGESDLPETIEDAVLLFGMQPHSKALPVNHEICKLDGVNPMFYTDPMYPEIAMVEAFPREATKALAMKEVARLAGASRIVAFGDNVNDLPMLQAADVAVAVENAIDEVKEIADIIIDPHTEDSVARFILEDFQRNSRWSTR